MNTSDLNRTFSDITPDYNNQSYYSVNKTSYKPYFSFLYKYNLPSMVITLYSIMFALGTIGNGLVIWIAGFRMKNISAVWFLNLAVADFLCCASLPLRITDWISLVSYSPPLLCAPSMILFNMNVSASVLILTAMSIDRCVSVMWPFWAKVHRTPKLVRITAAIIWVFSMLLTGLMVFVYGYYLNDGSEWCLRYRYRYALSLKHALKLIRLLTMFVIPFLIILVSYVAIFLKLRKMKRPQRSQRPYRIITAVILCFFICWFPYYIWPLTRFYDTEIFTFITVNTIITNLACLNSCLNPIIYVFLAQDFKHGLFLRSIPSRLERALSEPPNDECRERGDFEDTRTTNA